MSSITSSENLSNIDLFYSVEYMGIASTLAGYNDLRAVRIAGLDFVPDPPFFWSYSSLFAAEAIGYLSFSVVGYGTT